MTERSCCRSVCISSRGLGLASGVRTGSGRGAAGRSRRCCPDGAGVDLRRDVLATPASAATPAFVQGQSQEVQTGTTNTLAFPQNNTAGDLIVVSLFWDSVGTVTSLTPTATRTSPVRPADLGQQWSAKTLYAKNIAGGANTVTVTFSTPITSFGTVYVNEYSGIDKVNPVDVNASRSGTGQP